MHPKMFAKCTAVACALVGMTAATAEAGAPDVINVTVPLTVEATNPGATIPAGAPDPSGLAMLEIDPGLMTLSWDIDYENLTGPIVAPGAHFHGPAPIGTNAGVEIFITSGDPPSPATGNLTGSSALTGDQLDDLLADLWYINIHTEANGSGEIRGQVIIPEPASLGLLATGGLLLVRRRR